MERRYVRLKISTDGEVLHREIPLVDPELEPAEQVPDLAQTTHAVRTRTFVFVPKIGLVASLEELDDLDD